ncbi:MAG: 50S ribosomal protein L13 [bacterium]|nr:50S ribosomal protein L13 [bacterium]
MKTSIIPTAEPKWVIVDAEGQTVGRIATKIASTLRGKHNLAFSPHQLCGDHVVVINAAKLAFPQKKLLQKLYRSHSGYLGHLKTTTLKQMMDKKPENVVTIAVRRMLPANRLRAQMLKRLHVYAEDQHKHEAQQPTPLA